MQTRHKYLTKWRKENQEKIRKYNAEWRKANPNKVKAHHAKSYKTNYSKVRKHQAEYFKQNRSKFRANTVAYKARKRLATIGDLTDMAKIYERAEELRQWFDVVVDHIIPWAKGGTHEASNLQIIYASENRRKYDKLDYKPRVIFH
jgi:HNH endonuclease